LSTVISENSVCARISDRLVQSIGRRRYSMWFDRSVRIDYHGRQHRLEVAVPNQFVADWVSRNFKDELVQAACHELDDSVGFHVRVDPERFNKTQADNADSQATMPQQKSIAGASQAEQLDRRRGTGDLRHRLEDFVVGQSNELAYSAANRVSEVEATGINPLFIHGGCGLGKTHLLQGLCRKMLGQKSGLRVLYTTGEQFTNDFLSAMRANKVHLFRKRIRRLDLLAIDDIHFLANKQATQQEFLHSFDAIELGGARVVLASDSHPTLIQQFTEALVSRCVRGMVVQMKPPDPLTRIKIVQTLAKRRGLLMLESAVEALSSRCVGSVREIEGALTKLHALASLDSQRRSSKAALMGGRQNLIPVGNALVERLFQCELIPNRSKAIRFETILNTVLEYMSVDRARVLSSSRHHHIVLARALTIHFARQMTMMSYPEIAAAMGRRNHSTIVTAAQRIEKQLKANPFVILPATMEQLSLVELVEHLKRAIVRA